MNKLVLIPVFLLSNILYSQDDTIKGFNGCDTCRIKIPNVFTPNNDGKNDSIYPMINCNVSKTEILVFDENEQLLFSTNDIEIGWDGKNLSGQLMEKGRYHWLIRIWDLGNVEYTFEGEIFLWK